MDNKIYNIFLIWSGVEDFILKEVFVSLFLYFFSFFSFFFQLWKPFLSLSFSVSQFIFVMLL